MNEKIVAPISGAVARTDAPDRGSFLAPGATQRRVAETASSGTKVSVALSINGVRTRCSLDSRVTLLDALRERLGLTGTKKGCDHGQCGVCTVIIDGRRELSCLTLLAACEDREVTTIEGVASDDELHPLQQLFIRHDAFQCGFCTSGQICSMLALRAEASAGDVSSVTRDVRTQVAPLELSDAEIKERLSGNICRCGAYLNLVAAYKEWSANPGAASELEQPGTGGLR